MAIKIIKEGRLPEEKEHQHTCSKCTCVFTYQEKDTITESDHFEYTFIRCPFCFSCENA